MWCCRVEEVCEEETDCACEGGACWLSDTIRRQDPECSGGGAGKGVIVLCCIAMASRFGISQVDRMRKCCMPTDVVQYLQEVWYSRPPCRSLVCDSKHDH